MNDAQEGIINFSSTCRQYVAVYVGNAYAILIIGLVML